MRFVAVLAACVALTAFADVSPAKVMEKSDARLLGNNVGFEQLPAGASDAERSLTPYFAAPGSESVLETMPLKSTHTSVSVAGVVAHVQIRQVFENTGSKPIEAVYLFPASTRAAVHGMRMKIGERTVEAKIAKREEARKTFEAAREEGQRASLLEQQRPNVFTTSVTNLMPKDRVEVELDYSELLVPEDDVYELVVPAVVGPRYGGGADPKADKWIANPYLHAGEKAPYDFDVEVQVESALPLNELSSPSHPVDIAFASANSAKVTLKDKENAGTRDFVLRYRLAGAQIQTGVLADHGFFTVMLEPPARPTAAQIVPREYIFVLDVSGSMNGMPLNTAKALMRKLLGQLRSTDHFDVVLFAGAAAVMSEKSLPVNEGNIRRGIAFVDAQQGGGGTELLGGLQRAYAVPKVGEHVSRTVVVITDGYVGVEGKAFTEVRERLGEANVFAFGIGSSVNRGLIEALARAGQGEPYIVTDASKAEAKADALREAIEQPVLTNVRVRYDGFDAYEVAPMKLPDLMGERPLVVFGKFRGEPVGKIEVTGDSGGKPYRQVIDVASSVRPAKALQWLWARRWVETLEDQYHLTQADEVKDAIVDLGLSYRLLTPFTSFVAVDSEVVNKGGKAAQVAQPLPLPDGVSGMAVGGGRFAMKGALGGSAKSISGLGSRGYGAGGGGLGLGAAGVGHGSITLGGIAADSGGDAKLPDPQGTVIDEKVTASVGLGSDVINKVFKRHRNEVRYCYETALQTTPQLKGQVTVAFTIRADGKVSAVTLSDSSLKNPRMESCLQSRVQRWVFPQPKDGVTVQVTVRWKFALAAESSGP